MRRFLRLAAVALVCLLIVPAASYAQGTLSGVVKDTSGAVLPGVTIEAASPVLIEKVRTTVTDGSGQYRIVDLRGGIYTITFTLGGFATIKKEGVELLGEQIVTMNADMRVAAVAETITVTGETPVIDVQTTTRQKVFGKAEIESLPGGRNYQSFGQTILGVVSDRPDAGGAFGDTMSSLTIHGSKPADQRVLQNGVNTMTLQAGGNIGIAVPNPGMASEVTIDTSGVSAELGQGGVRINYIPRDGGNTFSGSTFVSFMNNSMQGDNLTDRLTTRGVKSVTSIKDVWDVNPGGGGPIQKDRVWFYFTARINRADTYAADAFFNQNAFDPTKWTRVNDLSRPASNDSLWTDAQLRLTAQVSPKNKVAFTWDQQTRCNCPGSTNPLFALSSTISPEAGSYFRSPTQRLLHLEWSSPVTNKLLVEAVALHRTERWGFMHPTHENAPDFISPAQEALLTSGALIPVQDLATGLQFRARPAGPLGNYNNNWVPNYYYRATTSYVTGGHQFKAGFTNVVGFLESTSYDFVPYDFQFLAGKPAFINQHAFPVFAKSDLNYDLGVFAQDRWTVNKLTAIVGVRFDAFKSGFPAQHLGPAPLTPTRNLDFPASDNINWKDVTPRFGASYDLTGDGKTAIKVSLNKYLQGQTLNTIGSSPNPVNRLVNTVTRGWLDDGTGGGIAGDFIPQCDLLNPAANGECKGLLNPAFGQTNLAATQFSEDLLTGWGHRFYNWEFSAGVQREVLPRVSVDVGYFRRWFGNFQTIDNLALAANEFDQFGIVVPAKDGLPTSGQTITGLYDPKKVVPGRNKTFLTSEIPGAPEQFEHWNGVDVNVNARLRSLTLFGGVATGRTMLDYCQVAPLVPESLTIPLGGPQAGGPPVRIPQQFCHAESPFLTQVKLNAVYTIPRVDVLLSGSFVSIPGPEVRANFQATNAIVNVPASLGRPLTGGATAQNNTVIAPMSLYGERLNSLDIRVGKILRFAGTRTTVNLDILNVFNSDAVTVENVNFAAYRAPTGIVLARYVKVSASFNF